MSIRITHTRDEITPDLRMKIAAARDPKSVMMAAGTQIVSITQRSFRTPALRQSVWAPKNTGEPSNLINKGMLVSSIRIVSVEKDGVTVGSDRKYAAIHQLGGIIQAKGKALVFRIGGRLIFAKKVKIPARPFFPFTADGRLAPFAEGKVTATIKRALALLMGGK